MLKIIIILIIPYWCHMLPPIINEVKPTFQQSCFFSFLTISQILKYMKLLFRRHLWRSLANWAGLQRARAPPPSPSAFAPWPSPATRGPPTPSFGPGTRLVQVRYISYFLAFVNFIFCRMLQSTLIFLIYLNKIFHGLQQRVCLFFFL